MGELTYMSAYMPLVLDNGKSYILNIPYFAQNDELNLDIIIMVVIMVNIAIVMMVLAFILSGLVAERVTRPLQMLNDKLKKMHVGGKNEKIVYNHADEVGRLVEEYNNMVDKLDESIVQLAKSERESAWREMARQIAHEIKNPLTPMKLNIQFMLRSLQMEDTEKFKERFRAVSGMLIEQIDNMAAIASAFSDFAKMSEAHNETFEVDELVRNCSLLFNIRTSFRFVNQVLLSPAMQNSGEGCFDSFEQMAADYSCLSNLLEELSAAVYTQEPRPAPPFEGPDSFLSIMSYLNAHYDQTVSLKRVSEELHLNASYISQLIKNETGLNYTQYITELRIEKAKELLTNTKLSLAEISEAVGFNDYFYFIKKFKREVGVTPGKFLQHEKGTGDMPDRERE